MRTIFLSFAISALLIGCGNNEAKPEAKAENKTATAEPATATPPPADTAGKTAAQPAPEAPKATTAAWKGVKTITDADFNLQVLGNPGLTVVDFSAVWCGPCKMLKPIFHKAADSFEGQASFATIDVDESPAVSDRYKVKAIPLLLFFKDGKQVHSLEGLVDAKTLNAAIRKALGS